MAFLRGFSILMGANLTALVLAFFNNKIIYMYLDRESNGVYFLAMRLALFVALLFGDWMRLSAFNIAGADRSLRKSLASNAAVYCLLPGIIITFPAAVLFPDTGSLIFGIPPVCIAVAALVASLSILRETSQSLLLVNKKVERYSITFIILGTVFLILDIIFLIPCGLGLNAVLTAWALAVAASAFWSFLNITTERGFSLKPSWTVLNRSRTIGTRALLAVAGMFLMMNIHAFVIEPATRTLGNSLVLVALFSVCFRIFQLFQRVADVTGSLLLSHVVTGDRESGFQLTARAVRGVFIFSVASALLGIFAGKYLVLIVADSKYADATLPLILMLPGMVAVTTGSVLNNVFWGNGYPYSVILAPFAAAILGLVLDILLLPVMGVGGATLAFSISTILWAIWIAGKFCRDSGLSPREVFIPRVNELHAIKTAVIDRLKRDSA